MKRALRDILTAREFEVCELVAEGKSCPEIASEMGISTRTVENHVHNAARLILGPGHPMKRIMKAFLTVVDDAHT